MADFDYQVLNVEDLPDGALKQVKAGETDVLVVHTGGEFYALGAHCPHYGAALDGGLLCNGRLTCPWHKAGFDVTTGKAINPPALDALPAYPVRVADGKITVTLPEREPAQKPVTRRRSAKHFAILGAGAAGIAASQALREFGFDGRISLISEERDAPYDRTALSKEFLSGNTGENELQLRPESFYSDNEIERVTVRVSEVLPGEKALEFEDGRKLKFDCLLAAPGGVPRSLEIPGAGLGNVFTLRTLADARKILEATRPGVRTVVIGGSFIALEVASCFALRKIPVTVIVPEKAPFAHTFGAEIGRALGHWHEAHGVDFRLGLSVERIAGTGMVREVVLQSGERIPADVIAVGSGVRPSTEILHQLPLLEDGSLEVDEYLCAAPAIYVAGDIATFPDRYSGGTVRIEHWRVAEQHGRTAAANMLARKQPFTGVPYFWTNHFGTRFDYVGHAEEWDDIVVEGDLNKPEYLAFYTSNDRVLAASACGRDRDIAALEQLFIYGRAPSATQIRKGVDLVKSSSNLERRATA